MLLHLPLCFPIISWSYLASKIVLTNLVCMLCPGFVCVDKEMVGVDLKCWRKYNKRTQKQDEGTGDDTSPHSSRINWYYPLWYFPMLLKFDRAIWTSESIECLAVRICGSRVRVIWNAWQPFLTASACARAPLAHATTTYSTLDSSREN